MKRVLLLIAAVAVGPGSAIAASKRPTAPVVDPTSMVAIPAGLFEMGVPETAAAPYGQEWFVDQQPQHPVQLSAYSIDRSEVTVADFARFLSYAGGEAYHLPQQPIERVDSGYLPVKGTDQQPMRQVTWAAADAYCHWAGKRLPTEAEWERAAAGQEGREYPWGNQGPDCTRTNFYTGVSFCEPGLLDVGSRPGGDTPEGIHDLAGGVAEWVSDRYGAYSEEPAVDPGGPADGALRVVRGGGFHEPSRWLRTRARWGAPPDRHSDGIGFRCAMNGPAQDGAIRGELSAVPEVGRIPAEPRTPAVKGPDVVLEGLAAPGAMVTIDSRVFVLERGAGRVLELGATKPVIAGLLQPVDLATDGGSLFVTEAGTGSVLRIDPDTGEKEVLASSQEGLAAIRADERAVAWLRSGTVVVLEGGNTLELGGGAAKVFALAPDAIYYGIEDASTAHLMKQPRAGGSATVVLDADNFGEALHTSLLTYASGRLYVAIGYRAFPYNAWVCPIDVTTGGGSCVTWSPPLAGTPFVIDEGAIYWADRSTLLRFIPGQPAFESLAPWTGAGGYVVEGGSLVWSDAPGGRVYRIALPQ